MKSTLLYLLAASLGLVAAQTNCIGSGYFCGRDLRLRSNYIYWCQDSATNPHPVVTDCYDECVPAADRNTMPSCVAKKEQAVMAETETETQGDEQHKEDEETKEEETKDEA